MKLSEILNTIDYELLQGSDIEITSIAYDSRKVVNGSLFVCISGFVAKGYDYIEEAIQNGAKAIVVEELMALSDDITIIKVLDARHTMAIASANFYDNPSKKMNLIGVTGTNGKTTTTFLIGYVLKQCNKKVGVIGTIENYIGDKVLKSDRTTPESLDLQKLFSAMVNETIEDVIMEVSSHSLVLNRVAGCEFEIGVFTNLTQDHLDFHKTMENYRQAKARLFKMCKKGIINSDDESSKYIADSASCDIITFGIENEADFRAKNITLSSEGVCFDVNINKIDEKFTLNIPGRFSVYNALGTIAACYSMGISVDMIRQGLKNAKGVIGRCQTLHSKNGFSVVVDYAHTPDGLQNIITAVNEFTRGRTIVVFGCGGDRDKLKRPIMGEIAGRLSDLCIITSDNPRSEEPDSILLDIETGILKTNCQYIKIVDRKMAIQYAMGIARKDDVIIVAGKGHETYQIFKDRTIHFDDVEIVKLFLQEE